jgi:cytochrome c peroxidase
MKKIIVFTILCLPILMSWVFLGEPTPYKLKYDVDALSPPNIPINNPMTNEGVWLGRLLFYDTLLSGNNKMSCGSCHLQKYSFSDNLTRPIGIYGDTLSKIPCN